jgi:hypothetical protein|tara:strand:- start:1183 stop:2274 length:1092 start_codon:yes stop_codon:yes gene_type:complete
VRNKKNIKKTRDERLHRRYLKFKRKQRKRRKSLLGISKLDQAKNDYYHGTHKDYKKVRAPKTLSLVTNTEETIKFISKVKEVYEKKKRLFVILRNVDVIEYDAIILLLSILIKFKSKKIDFNGDFPNNPVARRILINSNFFKYISDNFPDQDRYDLIKEGRITTHAQKKVDSELTDSVIKDSSEWVWKEERRCTGVQRALIELMHNTNNHAAFEGAAEKHWWLSVQRRKKDNTACFSFIDFGVGIFESLYNSKGKDSKWYNWKKGMSKFFNFDDDHTELLKLILNGSMHRTVTGKSYRGKGLPGIYGAFKRNDISRLHIISNDVFADVENNIFLSLKNEFSGTFVYWEVSINNNNLEAIQDED